MNNIIVGKDKTIKLYSGIYNLSFINNTCNIEIKGKVKILDLNKIGCTINILLCDNSELSYYKYQEAIENSNINITVQTNTKCNFVYNYKTYDIINNNLLLSILGNNNIVNVDIRSMCKNTGKTKIVLDAVIPKLSFNNEVIENIKVLQLNNLLSEIIPNMEVYSKEVIASHSATIGGVNPNDLFYLQSKGINEETAIDLISEGFIKKNLCEEITSNI